MEIRKDDGNEDGDDMDDATDEGADDDDDDDDTEDDGCRLIVFHEGGSRHSMIPLPKYGA